MKKTLAAILTVTLLLPCLVGCERKHDEIVANIPLDNYLSTVTDNGHTWETCLSENSLRYYCFGETEEALFASVKYCINYATWQAEDVLGIEKALQSCIEIQLIKSSGIIYWENLPYDEGHYSYDEFKAYCFSSFGDTPMSGQSEFIMQLTHEILKNGKYTDSDHRFTKHFRYQISLEYLISDQSVYAVFCKKRCTTEEWERIKECAESQIRYNTPDASFVLSVDWETQTVWPELSIDNAYFHYFDMGS